MSIVVLGAGVIGTTQAYYLARAGHRVTLVDRQPGPGLETSFANGGQISACHTQPWAHPQTLVQAPAWLGRRDAPLALNLARWDPTLWAWLLRFVANCTPGAYTRNMERAVRVALYSRACLKTLRTEEPDLDYQAATTGILKIYRDARSFETGLAALEAARAWGLEQEALDAAACVAKEPALGPARELLAGGILAPDDETGDAHLFTRALFAKARALGVDFRGETPVLGLEREGNGRLRAVITDRGPIPARRVVLALGSFSPRTLRTLDPALARRLPVYPAKGYSLTLPLTPEGAVHAPRLSLTDEVAKMVYARLGDRLRVAGTAELSGWDDRSLPDHRLAPLRREAGRLFPAAGDFATATAWCGLRPATPDSVPVIGPVPGLPDLILNTGHGTLGWTMACGSARLVADLLSDRAPEVSMDGLGVDRF